MVEGASIDKQAHNMDSERWILDTVEFDYAIGKSRASSPRTRPMAKPSPLITAGPRMRRRRHHRRVHALPMPLCKPAPDFGRWQGAPSCATPIIGTGTATAPQFPAVVGTYESARLSAISAPRGARRLSRRPWMWISKCSSATRLERRPQRRLAHQCRCPLRDSAAAAVGTSSLVR